MIAARHHDHIVIVRRHAGVQATVIGIDPLKSEALRRIETVVVGLFKLRLFPRHRGVVLVRGPGAGGALFGIDLHHQQTVRLAAVRQDVMHQPLVTPFTAMLNAHLFRRNHPRRPRALARCAAHGKLQIGIGGHFNALLRRHVDRPRRRALKRRHPPAEARKLRVTGFHRGEPRHQHQALLPVAALKRERFALFQHPDIKADIAPAGAFRGDVLYLARVALRLCK